MIKILCKDTTLKVVKNQSKANTLILEKWEMKKASRRRRKIKWEVEISAKWAGEKEAAGEAKMKVKWHGNSKQFIVAGE